MLDAIDFAEELGMRWDGGAERRRAAVREVVFDPDQEGWPWHLGVDPEDLAGADDDRSLGEYLQSEVSWRLIEWRDTREQRQSAAAPRLLRAS